ncbi:hypothetical protein Hanom_Chr06g00553991 [Helianthus anomalus]
MYQMNASDKLYLDQDFPIQNFNLDKIEKVFKLVDIEVSDVQKLTSSKGFLKAKTYYTKPKPQFQNRNQTGGNGRWGGKSNQK